MKNQKAYILLLINTIFWGISPAIIKVGLEEIPATVFLYYRYLIVAVLVIGYLLVTGQFIKSLKTYLKPINLIVMGCLTPWNLLCLFWGLERTSSLIASVVSALTPIIAAIMGALFLKEVVTKSERAGIVFAFVGIVALVLLQSGVTNISFTDSVIGAVLVFAGGIMYTMGGLLSKQIPKKEIDAVIIASLHFALLNFAIVVLLTKPAFLIPQALSIPTLLSILYMAIPGTLIAFIAYQVALKDIEVSEASVFIYLQPLFGIPASMLIMGEKFDSKLIGPLILIMVGIWFSIREKLMPNKVN